MKKLRGKYVDFGDGTFAFRKIDWVMTRYVYLDLKYDAEDKPLWWPRRSRYFGDCVKNSLFELIVSVGKIEHTYSSRSWYGRTVSKSKGAS